MTVFFGYYSIRIKTIDLPEGKFGIYQRVYHLMFIPFFPKDQFWKPISPNKETIFSSDIKHTLNVIERKTKTPIWSYLGSGLAIAVVLLPLLFVTIGWLGSKSTKKIESLERTNHNTELIESPEIGDIYHFKVYLLKPVKSVNGSTIKYEKVGFIFSEVSYSISSVSDEIISLKALNLEGFNNYSNYKVSLRDKFTIKKSYLKTLSEKYTELKIGIFKDKKELKIYAGLDEITRDE